MKGSNGTKRAVSTWWLKWAKANMVVMRKNHIRHLPVMDHGRLLGIVSINDIVDAIIADQDTIIENLEDYICGGGYTPKVASR